jgi:hypothetical protein
MTASMEMWAEIVFDVTYLIVVWGLVTTMWRRRAGVGAADRAVARGFRWAFALLALGDTGHVGFRVWAYARGSLGVTVRVLGAELGLVGAGALSTAVTVTGFYVCMLAIWRARYGKRLGWFGYLLLASAVVRLGIMVLPQNAWNSSIPPWPWSLVRNAPLVLQGLGVTYLILRDAIASRDRLFVWIASLIIVSFGFYLPVILLVQRVPVVGMLMIPKTMAYVAIAWLAVAAFYPASARRAVAAAET